MPSSDYLSLLPNVEVLSLPSNNALQQPCPPLSRIRTLYLGESRLLCDAELRKDGISPSRFVIEPARLLRILVNISNNPSIRNEGRTRWISETCLKLQKVGDLSLDWEKEPLWRSGRVLTTAWLLRDCAQLRGRVQSTVQGLHWRKLSRSPAVAQTSPTPLLHRLPGAACLSRSLLLERPPWTTPTHALPSFSSPTHLHTTLQVSTGPSLRLKVSARPFHDHAPFSSQKTNLPRALQHFFKPPFRRAEAMGRRAEECF